MVGVTEVKKRTFQFVNINARSENIFVLTSDEEEAKDEKKSTESKERGKKTPKKIAKTNHQESMFENTKCCVTLCTE